GIGWLPIPEYDTSQFCFNCNWKAIRPRRHFVVCQRCGKLHSDTNGAINILKLGLKLKNLDWKKIREVHLIWKFKRINRWVFRYLRIYEKNKDKLLVRGRVNNPPVVVATPFWGSYCPKSNLASPMRGGWRPNVNSMC
ncbi:MAG: hypothetical protein DSZ30_05230, partial [Aquificaceae bacterium]